MQDITEGPRLERLVEINSEDHSRAALEAKYSEVLDTQQLVAVYEVLGFMAPLVVVRRRADNVKGSLEFSHSPRFYFNFRPHDPQ